ncbi:translation initiation factor IF-2-like [Triticum aestivum]|uniref:translation initiation factor IF-2-like n=1 Tax=Triticum aestivum TaxID=4565 RepID=UPI000989CFC4|nr:translation initiation factor IF-2-like [Triticum aestivum]
MGRRRGAAPSSGGAGRPRGSATRGQSRGAARWPAGGGAPASWIPRAAGRLRRSHLGRWRADGLLLDPDGSSDGGRPAARGSGGACSAAPALRARRTTRVGQRLVVAVAPAVGGGVGRSGGGGLPVSWRLHGGSADRPGAAGFFGVGSSAVGPFRPSTHLLVAGRYFHRRAGPLPAAVHRSSRARCNRTELVSRMVQQD